MTHPDQRPGAASIEEYPPLNATTLVVAVMVVALAAAVWFLFPMGVLQ